MVPSDQAGLFSEHDLPRIPLADAARGSQSLADQLPSTVRLGTCSWSFAGWRGLVYGAAASQATLARHGLATYARHPLLRTVSLDRGYYAPIPRDDLLRYLDQVPEDFRFVVKAHEDSCWFRFPNHPRLGARAGQENPLFLDPAYCAEVLIGPLAEVLGPRLGAVLFQFPPQAPHGALAPGRIAERLHRFLVELQGTAPLAVELRTAAWVTDAMGQGLADAGARAALTVHPQMPSLALQREMLEREVPGPLVVRWMLPAGDRYEAARDRYHPFDRRVDPDLPNLRSIADAVTDADLDGRESLVLVNNKAEGSAPLSVEALAEELAGRQTEAAVAGEGAPRVG